ncbi:ATP-binding cassette domain-containing protein [Neorhizobium sp. JUb45]|uniref:ATP-binding cassette domain-containing protein n=1 Tax=unclassified Neorhizobium TaxID=2629175 RepID=UPI00104A0292|nr:ATP-binding cassette domain-containing protein [Neorhizobium sp. JUb45]TCR07107.1 peptide/nickel transport system ATP-binding protein [Neorhizobium sp. JUb45]
MKTLLSVENLRKRFVSAERDVAAVDGLSFSLGTGETLGIAGASGSGKSTLARLLLRLIEPDAGGITFEGSDWLSLKGSDLRHRRGRIQMVFQDILGAFHPSATVNDALGDPLRIHGIVAKAERSSEIARLLERVGLSSAHATRPVRELSGGQRQRVAIARAIASRPSLVVLDEAVSALDVQLRNRILELLVELQRENGISYLFISHDLAVLRAVSHRLAIMDAGRIVETGNTTDIINHPSSAAGRALIAAVPRLTPGGRPTNTMQKSEPTHEP